MDLLNSDNPLLNDYKLNYVLKLIPQTFLGGAQLKFNFIVPVYIHLVQILLWASPFVVGTIFTLVAELVNTNEQLCALIFGVCMLIIHIAIHSLSFVLKQRLATLQRTTLNFLAEEDEIEFVSFLSMETLEFIIPKKKCRLNYLFHPIICGVVCGFSFMFLLPQRTNLLFGNTVGCSFYYIFGWVSVCVACYPLIGQNAKEPASFHIVDNWEILPISRSFYVIGFGVISYTVRYCGNCSSFETIDYIIHIIFVILPFFWLFGFLPPIDAFLMWGGEQILFHMLGGSVMATDGRLLIALLLSWFSVIIFHFIPLKIMAVIMLTSLSILLSLDVVSFVITCIHKITFGYTRIKNFKESGIVHNKHKTFLYVCYVLLIFIIANLITVLSEIYISKFTSYRFNIIAGVLFLITVLNKFLCSLQQVYVFFSIVRNPLYSKVCKKYGHMWLFCVASTVVRLIVLPVWLVLTISILLITTEKHPRSFLSSIMMFRAYRMVWQNTPKCTYDVILYIILIWSKFNPPNWNALDPAVQLFIVSMVLYFVITLTSNLWFIFILIFNSQTKQKNHQKKVNTAITVALCLFPFTLFVIAMTTLTTSPLLPLFTLPLFIVGFPRPLRMWPQASSRTKSSSKEWIYYHQLLTSIAMEIKYKFQTNGINTFEAGTYFLARFQDRLIWITILESGITHCCFVVKGLELQETSCHSTEAEVIDDIFQSSLDVRSKSYNEYITSALTAKFSLDVNAYSDAKNVLTGVIDSPENLESVTRFFPKALLWVLIRHCLHKRINSSQDIKHEVSQPADQGSYFTAHTDETIGSIKSKDVIQIDDLIIPKTPLVENSVDKALTNSPQHVDNNFPLPPVMVVEPKVGTNKILHKHVTTLVMSDESDDEFGDLGFSDDDDSERSSDNEEDEAKDNNKIQANPTKFGMPDYNNILNASKVIDPLRHWKDTLPFTENQLSSYSNVISQSWYECIIFSLDLNESHVIVKDLVLFRIYKMLVLSCYYIVDVAGVRENSSVKEGPSHVLKVFYGMLPWSPYVAWIESDDELKDLVVQAYRYAFKLALDNHVLGEVNDDDEILAMLTEYEQHWFIGEENSDDWIKNVLEEKTNLLSIFQEEEKGVFTSRSLSKQLLEVPIGELNKECVRGFWAALSLELYYMTNDDDERYSIQALPLMLRNIITQAADPPLGYPVYSSGLLSVHI